MKDHRGRILLSLLIVLVVLLSSFSLTWATPHAVTTAPHQSNASISHSLAPTDTIHLTALGRIQLAGAEIGTFDAVSQRAFVVGLDQLSIIDLSNPLTPTLIMTKTLEATSVDVKGGLVAIAVPANPVQNPGRVVFMDINGTTLGEVTVGALPDMLTFTPDGTKVLVANEGEADGANNPEGTVSVIDVSNGPANATVRTATFTQYNSQRDALIGRGVRIFPNAPSVAQDFEPEYIAINPDGVTAWVTLQEANSAALLDIATATTQAIVPFGSKDHSRGLPSLTTYEWVNRPTLAFTAPSPAFPSGQEIKLGGFSGLFFEGVADNGNLKFVTHPDRGPNGEPTDLLPGIPGAERPFPLPNFQPEIVRFELTQATGAISITQRIPLFRQDGTTKLTGLPNLQAGAFGTAYTDEVPIDLFGQRLPNDPLGADLEGIVVAPDGTFWMVDEYRPAIYHFLPTGVLANRYVPVGTAASVSETLGTFGTEVLPAVYAQRRNNRGFEAVALDGTTLYAFIQSGIDNPDTANDATSRATRNLRIVALDTVSKTVTAEYLYLLDDITGAGLARTDKLGDAVSMGNGRLLVAERDDRTGLDANKLIFDIDLRYATNVHDPANLTLIPAGKTLEQLSPAELAAAGIKPAPKRKVANLAPLGYTGVSKLEGLAMIDANTLAVINDNDFGVLGQPIAGDGTIALNPNAEPVSLGIIEFNQGAGLDASDRDGPGNGKAINIRNWPVLGLYMPDGIASFTANSQPFYITANEGDARTESVRISTLNLDPTAFPNAAELKQNANLGRLNASNINGDLDGDGDYDRLYVYGARSFTIRDAAGNLVFDSGDQLEQLTAQLTPGLFNANDGNPNLWDERSDDKGPEPEGVAVGVINGRTYAFVGLERAGGGIMAFDVTDPYAPTFVQYLRTEGDVSPEGIKFVSAADSPTGHALLLVTNELSNTLRVIEIEGMTAPTMTDDPPYVKAVASGVSVAPILTVAETVPLTSEPGRMYRMVGIPDGLGAYKATDGSVRLLMNHELNNNNVSAPIVGGTTITRTGAFISEYSLTGSTPVGVESGDLAFNTVVRWENGAWVDYTGQWRAGTKPFGRFCSGYLAGPWDGISDYIYLAGEETGASTSFSGLGGEVVAVANGTAYVLPHLGHIAVENAVMVPGTGAKTVVFILEDGPNVPESQLYMYVGTKNPAASNPVERAGLVGGDLYVFRSTTAGRTSEANFHKADGTITGDWARIADFLQPGETVASITDTVLNERSKTAGAFGFIRIEDGTYDRNTAGVFYFATTGSGYQANGAFVNALGRVYRLRFDAANPTAPGAQLTVLLEAAAGDPIINPDNLDVNRAGQMTLNEDPTAEGAAELARLGRDSSIWLYDLPGDGLGQDGMLVRVAEIDQTVVAQQYRGPLGNWETSGIIDVSDIYGPGTWLFDVQAHSLTSPIASLLQGSSVDLQVVQGGQLLLLNTANLVPPQVTPTPTGSVNPTATATVAPTGTATTAPTATATPQPTNTPTATPTTTATPRPTNTPFVCNPGDLNSVCGGIVVVRAFIDFGCDTFFNRGTDWPLAGTTITATLPDGTTKTAVVDFNGNAVFSGIALPPGGRVQLTADNPPVAPTWVQQQGFGLAPCASSTTTVSLGRTNFTGFAVAYLDFRFALTTP